MGQAVLITNLILLETPIEVCKPEARRSGKALALVVEQATAEREREVKLFLNYDREAVNISGECGAASDALVCAAVGKPNSKPKRQTRLKGDERRTGMKMLDPTRIVSEDVIS